MRYSGRGFAAITASAARTIAFAIEQPDEAHINEIVICQTAQEFKIINDFLPEDLR